MRKKRIWLVGVLFFIILWLLFSTSLISRLFSQTATNEINFNDVAGKQYIEPVIQTIKMADQFTENLFVNGYYVPKNVDSIDNNNMALILAGDDHSYKLSLEVGKLEVPGVPRGNIATFSCNTLLLSVKNGTYDFFFYCKENEDSYGLADIRYRLEKTNDGVDIYPWNGEKTTASIQPTNLEALKGWIEGVRITDGEENLQIQGWAGMDNCENAWQEVWLELIDSSGGITRYTARQMIRWDVASYYGDNYLHSGYFSAFPSSDLADDVYNIRVLLKQNEEIFATDSYTLIKQDKRVSLVKGYSQYVPPTQVVLDDLDGKSYVPHYFEAGIQENETSLLSVLSGWSCVVTGGDESNREVSLVLDGDEGCYQVKTVLTERPDVVSAYPGFGIENDHVGFSATIFAGDFPTGDYKLYIFDRENETDAGLMDTYYRVKITEEGMRFSRFTGERVTDEKKINSDELAIGSVDVLSIRDGKITVYGWAAINGHDCENQSVYVELMDANGVRIQYTAEQILRPDITSYMNGQQYLKCGYFSSFQTTALASGEYTLRIIVQNGTMVTASAPYSLTVPA